MKKIIISIIVIAVISVGVYTYTTSQNKAEVEQIACTMDARMCPDGSYVGRQGPKCEFEACPNTKGVEVKVSI
ncbi:MAG: hypothetical protein RLZZ67_395 [Candidatus Parcubacteria bacterium]|jgi:Phr family secreted Rap phosphatase inhibitor